MSLRLALGPLMQQGDSTTLLEQQIADGADVIWTMDETSGDFLDSVGGAGTDTLGVGSGITRGATALILDGGAAATFNGSSDYGTTGTSPPSTLQGLLGTFSVEFMIDTANAAQAGPIIYQRRSTSPFSQWGIMVGYLDAAGAFQSSKHIGIVRLLNTATADRRYRTTAEVIDGNPHFIGVSWSSGAGLVVTVDGVAVATTTIKSTGSWPNSTITDAVEVGRNSAPLYFAGTIDHIAFYEGVALTEAQFAAHYALT